MDCKTCKTCEVEKPLSEFHKNRKYKNTQYYQSYCKSCFAKKRKEHYQKNREAVLAQQKEYYADPKNREARRAYSKEYNADPKNREAILAHAKKYNASPKGKERKNARIKEKKQSDPLYKLKLNTRSLISHSIKKAGFKKNSKTHKILNCSFEEFMSHLEKQFNSGITWENYGKWHLDHIVPVSLASTEEEIIKLNHYKNFQPMWGPENNSKSNKIIHEMITPELQEKYKEILQRAQPA